MFLQYLDEIPVSLDESAYLDGANYFGIFWRIILPNLKAPIVTMLIISGVGVYNDFYNPFLYMPDRKLKVISTALFCIQRPLWNQLASDLSRGNYCYFTDFGCLLGFAKIHLQWCCWFCEISLPEKEGYW